MAYSSHGSRRQTEKRKKETAEEEVGVQRQERGTGSEQWMKGMGLLEIASLHRSDAVRLTTFSRAYVERVIGSIRRECLDHVIYSDEASLRYTLRSYFRYYHTGRLHLSLKSVVYKL